MDVNTYIKTPIYTTLKEIKSKNFTLSATQHKKLCLKNDNLYPVAKLLDRPLERSDLGYEVGSGNYVENSQYKFIKTKALQPESYLLSEGKDSVQYITPQSFTNMNLKKGDIIISKDANVGEAVILDKDYDNTMLCGGIYRLPISKNKYYFLAFTKHEIFRQQIDFMVPRGSTLRHGKTIFLNCLIPFPKTNTQEIVKYVEILVKAILRKEIAIRQRYYSAMKMIEDELKANQNKIKFNFHLPSIKEILNIDRMDSRLYTKEFKKNEFLTTNYKYGFSTLHELGFILSRGQNLQISNIGESIYSYQLHSGYYTLVLPKFISKYGTVIVRAFLGNPNQLKTLKSGEIIFGAEGNEKGRSFVVTDEHENVITNIHGITLTHDSSNLLKSIFVKLLLDYYRSKGMIDSYAVGSNGGSLAIKYINSLKFPNFPIYKERNITKLYYSGIQWDSSKCDLENFESYDKIFTKDAGILELDRSIKYIQQILEQAMNKIIDNKIVKIIF